MWKSWTLICVFQVLIPVRRSHASFFFQLNDAIFFTFRCKIWWSLSWSFWRIFWFSLTSTSSWKMSETKSDCGNFENLSLLIKIINSRVIFRSCLKFLSFLCDISVRAWRKFRSLHSFFKRLQVLPSMPESHFANWYMSYSLNWNFDQSDWSEVRAADMRYHLATQCRWYNDHDELEIYDCLLFLRLVFVSVDNENLVKIASVDEQLDILIKISMTILISLKTVRVMTSRDSAITT